MLEDEPEKVPDTAGLLEQLRDILEAARKLPMSASVSLNRAEFGAILLDAIDGLPEELREARWLRKEREQGQPSRRGGAGPGRADGREERARAGGPANE